jgi:DNA-directed RNA polymerase subunit RPC12/RpoP
MSLLLTCPDCAKKLKVADNLRGRKVKCTCGHVFVADAEAAPAADASPEKVLIACGECMAKLKVAATALGKKMRCPKCGEIFVSAAPEAPSTPIPSRLKKAMPPAAAAPSEFDEDEEAAGLLERNGAPDDDLDFSEEEAAPPPKAKKRAPIRANDDEDEDDDEPRLKVKAGKGRAAPRSEDDEEDDEAPVKPVKKSRLKLLLGGMAVLVLVLVGVAAADYLGYLKLGILSGPTPVAKQR